MTKLLQNKSIIKFLGIALSILLIVALVPQINIAYGSKDDVLADTGTEESAEGTTDLEGTEGTEDVEGEEEGSLSGEDSSNDATLGEEEPPAGEGAGIMATALPEEDPVEAAEPPAATTSKSLSNNTDNQSIEEGDDVTNASSPLTFSGNKTYTLTVNGTLRSDIRVTNGAVLTIKGEGTIIGTHAGSVITVEGTGAKLILGEISDGKSTGPTITNGTGSTGPSIFNDGAQKVGGGIYVYNRAALDMQGGKITGNTANAGGGVFVWTYSFFTMAGGEISSNTATTHEGGGIFFDGQDGYISGGSICENTTNTTVDWGGGGVYVNNNGSMRIDSARITGNTANALGGGIAGCPHAKIGIGELGSGAAVYGNFANMGPEPDNDVLRFNMPVTTNKDASYRVPSGDVLVYGASKDQPYTPWGTDTEYKALEGEYAKNHFDKKWAKDYYCTLASSIAGTDLGNADGIAWTGFVAKIDPTKISDNKVDSDDVEFSEISIRKGQDYSIADATLCLASEATKDLYDRKVIISGNTSGTHGGGISCNGTLSFGPRPETKEVVDGYNLTLNKKLITNLSGDKGIDLSPGEFEFELSYEEDGKIKTCSATNDGDGNIEFEGLPGSKVDGNKVTYNLKENLSNKQVEAGYESPIPEDKGWDVVVTQKVSCEVHSIPPTTETIYTTEAAEIVINDEATKTVTNTLNLNTSANIPVTKVAEGIGAGTFTFGLKDITGSIGNLVDFSDDKVVLKENTDLAAQALTSPNKTATITVEDSTTGTASTTDEGSFTFGYVPQATEETHWYAIAEQPGATAGVVYDTTAYLVKITTKVVDEGRSVTTSTVVYKTAPDSEDPNVLKKVGGAIGVTFTNVATPKGTWQFQADKFFYGLGDPRDCSFTMQEIERVPEAGEPLANVLVSNDNLQQWTASVKAGDFKDSRADIVFPEIAYEQQGEGEGFQNDVGDHYYLVTEDGEDAAKDTTAYVVKVTVAVDDENDPRKLVPTETVLGYADDIDSPLNPLKLSEGELPAFYNTDTYDLISAASYSVYAASGEPVDQVCYVDPKIVKNLEGRAIKSGEFAFKLIQVANYNDTEGEVISAATNDEFGMVDFDKANNVGTLENPTCLAYTAPNTYYYRVIEDTSNGGMKDQSVLYSDQVITFTTVIGEDVKTGKLVCTDMYYGYWDKAANKNVPFKEQYIDYETQPANIGDMSKLNPDWHPTITNKARPMDLQVRKTSVTDRDEGLVGATYALYMVNDNVQGDIWLAEATSEEGGWITYKNVSLSTNNLYYFKETAAPAGHTVSEFRSPYFYLVEDATSPNGYALKYSDTKYFDAAEVEAAAIPMAAAEAQALQADIAAQAEAAATDDQTQPGHSADGNILLTYDKDGGVYDETTQVEVNKLDTRTHEWVEGAKLVILEKESGKEVASWTSGKAPQKLAKTLNVGITYLLREVEAPGEYRLANDVEFVIDNYGNVSITKGTENGNAELSDNTITLYDTMMDAEEVEQRERETTREVPLGTILAQTGDMLPILGIGAIVLASLIALIVAGRRRHEGKDDKN